MGAKAARKMLMKLTPGDVEEEVFDPDRMNEQITFRDRSLRALLHLQPLEGDVDVGVAGHVEEAELFHPGRLLASVDPE